MARKKKSKEEIEFDKNFTEEEKLQIENDLLQLKIETEIGAELKDVLDQDLPPTIQNEILNQVYQFFKNIKNVTQVRLYDYIGKPEYVLPEELKTEKAFAKELRKIVKWMKKKGVDFNIEGEQTSEILYTFIIEEFFEIMIDDIKSKGSRYYFEYEDFYPNIPRLLYQIALNSLRFIFRHEDSLNIIFPFVHEKILLNAKLLSNEAFQDYIESIEEFLPTFERLEVTNLTLDESETHGIIDGICYLKDTPPQRVMFEMHKSDHFWHISSLSLDLLTSK
jgi:hypothetical protein